jgi:hypothetical protein
MRDTIKEADLILAEIMGFGTPDHPKWAWHRMPEDSARLESERYRWRQGYISKGEYDRYKRTLERNSRSNYDRLYPRRPEHWEKVIREFLKASEKDRDSITRDGIRNLIAYCHPDAIKERRNKERQAAQARKKAKGFRNLPENKNQRLPDGKIILWNEEGEPVTDNVRRPRRLRQNQYDPEGVLQKLLRLLRIGPREAFRKELDKQISEEVKETRLKSSIAQSHQGSLEHDDTSEQNTSEYRDGFSGNSGYMPLPGRKPSGRFRRRWGMK